MLQAATFETTDTPIAATPSRFRWMRDAFTTPSTRFVGIDFSIPTVRIATLDQAKPQQRHSDGLGPLHCTSCCRIELPFNPLENTTPELIDRMVDRLGESLPRCVDGEENVAVLSMPSPWIHYETIPVAPASDAAAQLPVEIRQRCDQMFRASAFRSSAHLSHWPVASGAPLHVLAATATDTACKIAEHVSDIGYHVQSILPHGVALGLAAGPLTSLQPRCLVLLQRLSGLVCVTQSGRCGLSRVLPNCPRQVFYAEDVDSLHPWIEQVAKEIQATLKFAARNQSDVDPDAVVMLCGDLAHIEGIDVAFANFLQRPVAKWMFTGEATRGCFIQSDSNVDDPRNAVAFSLAFAASRSVACKQGGRTKREMKAMPQADDKASLDTGQQSGRETNPVPGQDAGVTR
tara:strand:+ start:56836 stop:58044 length:1209 start_codon:yes stop_codon:yes gene_type:complete